MKKQILFELKEFAKLIGFLIIAVIVCGTCALGLVFVFLLTPLTVLEELCYYVL